MAERKRHPLLGRASVHASLIRGGHELSSYPAQCDLQIERRTLPGEPDAQVAGECAAIVQKLAAEDEAFHGAAELFSSRAAYEIAADSPIAQAAARAVGEVARDHLQLLARCGFDAFELREGEDAGEALGAFDDLSEAYQASAAQPLPLFRRRAAA